MTVIVGLRYQMPDGMAVLMGCDSQGTASDWAKVAYATPKVFRNGPALIGSAGSWRLIDLLHHALEVPALPELVRDDVDATYQYMVRAFIPAVRHCLSEHGYAEKKDDRVKGGYFLVGLNGCLFEIGEDYDCTAPADDYRAIGAGGAYAMGSLATTQHPELDLRPLQRVGLALDAAGRHCAGVGGPMAVMQLPALANEPGGDRPTGSRMPTDVSATVSLR